MPKPFHALNLEEFADLLGQFPFTRRVDAVHVHHTWRPNHANWHANPGVASIEAMFRHHTQVNGWSDIGQHITIDPAGIIWTGRDWNRPPASSAGFNGTSVAGPFMFEMIGDFDSGRDPFDGPQKESALAVVAHVMRHFGLSREAVRFHSQMSTKTCPGTAIDRDQFLTQAVAALTSGGGTRDLGTFTAAETATRSKSLSILARWEAQQSRDSTGLITDINEPAEETMDANAVTMATNPEAIAASRGIFGETSTGFTAEEKIILRKHVVNLRLGEFSDSGLFETSLADVQRIFNELLPAELEQRRAAGEPFRLIFFAHGGLVSEESGIRPVLRRLPFWVQNGIYPIFFCWETGLKESVQDLLQSLVGGQRGLVSDANDAVLEAVAGAAGRQIWGQMKRSAELASLPGGGARTVAEMTRDFWNDHHAEMEIHSLGHSAGSIFHSFFLPVLLDQPVREGVPPIKVETLHFLAPACTTELFEDKLMSRIGDGKMIVKHTMYTMNKDLEKDDTAGPYRKSLLYFVSRAFETKKPTPILGLEESLRDDSKLIRFYGLTRTAPGQAQILFSKTPSGAPLDTATESTSHGDFDNEVKTMNSVARRILRRPEGSIVSFVDETTKNETTRALKEPARATGIAAAAPAAIPTSSRAATAARAASNGAKKALCIGIDSYPGPNALSGCVNDARDWEKALTAVGFNVARLHNEQAKHAAILDAMRDLITTARSGDVLVIQYSGHGTEVKDLDGDETNGLDQALVPVDFEQGKFLIDDEIREIMGQIPDGVSLTCFMDCCHSGTNTRLFGVTPATVGNGSKARFLPMNPQWTEAHIQFRRSARGIKPSPRTAENMREVNFAACRSSEVAFETSGSGDFTKRALEILSNGFDGLTHDGFLERVTQSFGPSPRQHPFLDCGKDAGTRALLAALGITEDPKTPPPAEGSLAKINDRLDRIEQRLAKLGA